MEKVVGLVLVILAVGAAVAVLVYVTRKGIYNGDILEMILDLIDFLVLIGAMILLGIILLMS